MATAREHFALDWIKADLLETLNEAREALDDYAEQGGDETRLRACLTGLHQVHGTLVMLELKGVTQLADHLERLAEALLAGALLSESDACRALMQGILELPGYLDELQRGGRDSISTSMTLVNEIRDLLGMETLVDPAGVSLHEGASTEALSRFNAIDGAEKVSRIRSAYQNVLLSILKGEDRRAAVETLSKIATGLEKVTEGAPMERQWQAFGEFVSSLDQQTGVLESEAVKLLRRVDLEIKNLAQSGDAVLRRPVNTELVQQLLDAAVERDHRSAAVTELQEAISRDVSNNTLAISGRQALASAAGALQEDLGVVKDKLDLLVRSGSVDAEELRGLITPLKKIGSTLSVLGFESSREIVTDQVEAIEGLIANGDSDPLGVQSIAGALVQIDENLNSVAQGSQQTEVERITNSAQLQVLKESRKDLEHIKQCIVDFVTAHWSVGHLEGVPTKLGEIRGALEIVPLPRAIGALERISGYIEQHLMQGHRPDWQELDLFADIVSALDYYLERLSDETTSGADDIIAVAERSLSGLEALAPAVPQVEAEQPSAIEDDVLEAEPEPESEIELQLETEPKPEPELQLEAEPAPEPEFELELEAKPEPELDAEPERELEAELVLEEDAAEPQPDAEPELQASPEPDAGEFELELEPADYVAPDADEPIEFEYFGDVDQVEVDVSAEQEESAAASQAADEAEPAPIEYSPPVIDDGPQPVEDEVEQLDTAKLPSVEEPALKLEQDAAFDLSSDVFDGLEGAIEEADEVEPAAEETAPLESQPVEEPLSDASQAAQAEPEEEARASSAEPEVETEAPDPEIVEIFVEEVDEVLETIQEYLPQWAAEFADSDALTEVRRSFHTLKGSGRIVQAEAIGELGWGIENMLNRVIEETVTPNEQIVQAIQAACDLIPDLRTSFAAGEPGDIDAVGLLIERADLLASGAEVTAEPASAPTEPEQLTESAQTAESAQIEQPRPDQHPEAAEVGGDQEQTASDQAHEERIEELSAIEVFIDEALQHVQTLDVENARTPWQLNEVIARAFHTLAGGAASVELAQVQFIVEPANQVVEAFRDAPASDELREFFEAVSGHLKQCLTALQAQQDWEEPFELVAAADDLLAGHAKGSRGVDKLLGAPVTADMLDAEAAVEQYLTTACRGDEAESIGLQNMLKELAGVATEMQAPAVAALASALQDAFARADTCTQITSASCIVLRSAYDQLIAQLNDIAAGVEVRSQPETIAALEVLEFSPAQPQAASPATPDPVATEVAETSASSDADEELVDLLDVDADLVQVFFEEAEEISEELEGAIVSWSKELENRLYMEILLRGLHTLKGGARLCGLAKLGDMAHEFESVVIDAQGDERAIDADLFDELTRRYDEVTNRLTEVKRQVDAAPSDAMMPPEPFPEPSETPAAVQESQSAPPPTSEPVDAKVVELPAAASAQASPARPSAPAASEEPEAKPEVAANAERGNQEMVRVGSGLLEELVNLAGESSILRARVEQGMSDFTAALDEMETTIERVREQLRRLEIETETQILFRHDRVDSPQYENFDPLEMDRYNQLQQLSRGLTESASDMLDLKDTLLFKARESETLLLQQARINTELQEGLMRTRMVPFSRLLPRLRRIVRQVAGELGKDVELHVQNAEGELDRNLLERMVPPLEHMLRNAVDHGIEGGEMRRNVGKSATGRIDLRLTREGGDVVIEIGDDGAGIDVEVIRAKAIERELMAADANLNDEQVLQFVLAPGFSTAKSVTQISGRGVGLDVVHSEVKQLGGSVHIVSRPGKGTRFVLRVPFTVSVNRALMVSVAEDLYAIPLNNIEGIVLLSQEQLQALYSSETKNFEYAGVPYRVRYLGQYLGREYHAPANGQSSVPVVLVRSGDHAVAIHVDQVQGSREIVVKSLGPQFAGVGGISGATILGDGSVVVILDLLALIRAQHHDSARRAAPGYTARSGPRCVMVVDDSVTVRKVTSRLLERQGMDVLVAKDGVEAVAMLQERRPDIMLLDIEMPRMDGFEVARQVRHDERLNDLPIVMISSRTGEKHKEHAGALGVNKFLGKPFQENELLATIDELVADDVITAAGTADRG